MSLDITLIAYAPNEVYSANYTHNVVPMWKLAGVYGALYGSDGMTAIAICPTLLKGYQDMKKYPKKYRALNPSNGWGHYDTAMKFIKNLYNQCKKYPDSIIHISA